MKRIDAKQLSTLSDAQLQIMREVWKAKEVTVTQVWDSLSKQRPVARNTIHTQMDRLEKRGWLKRRKKDRAHFYVAATSQQSTLQKLVRRLVDTAFGGSPEELVLALLNGRRLTDDETARIQTLINNSKKEES